MRALKKMKMKKIEDFSSEDVKKFRENFEEKTKDSFRKFFISKTKCWIESKRKILD